MIDVSTTWARRALLGAAMTFCLGATSAGCANDTDSQSQAVRPNQDSGTDVVTTDGASDSAGTDGSADGSADGGSDGGTCAPLETLRTLNTYIGTRYVEVDRLSDTADSNGLYSAADANLVSGATPGYMPSGNDGNSISRQIPPLPPDNAGLTFRDWGDLAQATDPSHPDPLRNFRILDGVNGTEGSMFPRKNDSCIAAGQIGLDKQDLTYVGAANNDSFVYLIVQRRDNNGDSGYVWLFTHDQPTEACTGVCQTGERLLQYNLKPGDVLVLGEFNPSSPTRLRVFTGRAHLAGDPATVGLPSGGRITNAYDAINTDNANIWTEVTTTAITAANTTTTPPTVWGSQNVSAVDSSGNLLHDIVAEAAVDIHTFIGTGGSTCGQTFWGSVISRSSTSVTSDLKDLVGPAQFNFGSVTANPTVTQTCTRQLHLRGTATDGDGHIIADATCTFVIDEGTMAEHTVTGPCMAMGSTTTSADYYYAPMGGYAAGSMHTVKLTASGGTSSCSNTANVVNVTIGAALGVTPSASGNCSGQITYSATVTGPDVPVSYAWTWSNSTMMGGFTYDQSGQTNRTVSPANITWNGSVTITETNARTGFDSACSATGMTTATPYTPLSASLAANRGTQLCTASPSGADSDKITYTLTVTGRDGTYPISGFPAECINSTLMGTPTSVTISSGTGTIACDIDPSGDNTCANITVQVTVDDSVCTDPTTSNLHYIEVSRVCVCTVGDTTCENRCLLPL